MPNLSDEPVALTEGDIRAADPQLVLNLINSWPQAAQRLVEHGDAYAKTVSAPEWSGNTAGTVNTAAFRQNAAISDDAATVNTLHSRSVAAMDYVIRARSAVLRLIDEARSTSQLTVGDDLTVTATDIEYQAVANAKEVAIRQAAQKWSEAENYAANEIRTAAAPLTGSGHRSGVQLVDNRTPLAPARPMPQDVPQAIDESDLRPPADSGAIAGHWRIDRTRAYDKLPDFPASSGVPQAFVAEHRKFDRPITGASTGLKTIGTPQPGSVRGGEPAVIGKEAYRFRITGESFNPTAEHVQWVQQDGKYYMAQWIDHDLQVEHTTVFSGTGSLAGMPQPVTGLNQWSSIDIAGISGILATHPSMDLYVPGINGSSQMIGPNMPAPANAPDIPQMRPASPLPLIPAP
ncbi:MAG: hypothetical protein H6523_12795 [Mycolicibacterium sp.]|nr:hypothetical protein [Mycolicibacterium sp.]